HIADGWMRRTALIAGGAQINELLAAVTSHPQYLKDYPRVWGYRELLRDVYELIGTRNHDRDLRLALSTIVPERQRREKDQLSAIAFVALNGLAQGLSRRGAALGPLLAEFDNPDFEPPGIATSFARLFVEALRMAADPTAPLEFRGEAIAALS